VSPGTPLKARGATRPEANTSPVERLLIELREQFRDLRDGDVASYIPELLKANPD